MIDGLITWWFVDRLITIFGSFADECLAICEEEFDGERPGPAPSRTPESTSPRPDGGRDRA